MKKQYRVRPVSTGPGPPNGEAVIKKFNAAFFRNPYLLLSLASLFWAGNAVLGRAVRAEVPPVGLAFCRWFFGFLFIIGFALPHLKKDFSSISAHWKIILILSFLGIATFNTLLYIGLHSTTAINAMLVQSAMPVFIVIFTFLIFGEKVTGFQSLGIFISLTGAVTIVAQGSLSVLIDLAFRKGDIWVFIAVVSYAAYSTLLKKKPPLHPLSFLAVTFGTGTLMLTPLFIWEQMCGHFIPLNRISFAAIGYVSIFPSILSYLFFNRGIELIGPNRGGLFIHLVPVFGILMAVLLLGERFRLHQGGGICLILTGIFMVTHPGGRLRR